MIRGMRITALAFGTAAGVLAGWAGLLLWAAERIEMERTR